jgi:hypothetical protein
LKEQEEQAHQLKRKGNPRTIDEEDYPAIKAAVDEMLLKLDLKWTQIAKELNTTVNTKIPVYLLELDT